MYVSRLFTNFGTFNQVSNGLKFHTSVLSLAASVAKSDLAALRKKTGYSLSICKKALSENNNNLTEAETWLKNQAQAQGWAKAQKLQGRNTSQGLLGLKIQGQKAALVELNCETDFVARNEKFKSILGSVARTCLAVDPPSSQDQVNKTQISSEDVSNLKVEDGSSLADLVALNIGQIGENMTVGGATVVLAQSGVSLSGHAHPAGEGEDNLLCGRYVTVMAYTKSDQGSGSLPEELTEEKLPGQLCQHIIGMNPTAVSNEEDKENSLLHQPFLLDESLTVGKLCDLSGIKIVDFVRREIGRAD